MKTAPLGCCFHTLFYYGSCVYNPHRLLYDDKIFPRYAHFRVVSIVLSYVTKQNTPFSIYSIGKRLG